MGYIRRIWLSFSVGVLWSSILQFGWIIIYNCCLILSWWMAWSHNISVWQCILGCKCSICWIHGGHGTRSPLWGPRSYMTCRSCKSSVAICNMSKWHCVTCFHSRRGPLLIIGICFDVSTCSGYGHKCRLLYYLNDALIINGPFRCSIAPMSLVGGASIRGGDYSWLHQNITQLNRPFRLERNIQATNYAPLYHQVISSATCPPNLARY